MCKILPPMSSDFMAADPPVLHDLKARTGKLVIYRCCFGHKSRRRCEYLKCRSRFISVIDTLISPHLIQRILFLLLGHALGTYTRIQSKRIVQIKFRHIDAGIDLSVLRVHNKNGYIVRLLCLHDS